jgi:lipoate synthase
LSNSIKEIQENTSKQVEALKEEAQKSSKELQENTTRQLKVFNKIIQNLKRYVKTIKKNHKDRQG